MMIIDYSTLLSALACHSAARAGFSALSHSIILNTVTINVLIALVYVDEGRIACARIYSAAMAAASQNGLKYTMLRHKKISFIFTLMARRIHLRSDDLLCAVIYLIDILVYYILLCIITDKIS
jgi:hypothetical protein